MKSKGQKEKVKKALYTTENVVLALPGDYPWKILDNLIKDLNHLLTAEEKTVLAGIVRSRDYVAYLALAEVWGTQSTYLYGRPLAEMRAVYQVITLLRKYRFPSGNKARQAAALEKFVAAEEACAEYNKVGVDSLHYCQDKRMLNALTYAKAFLVKLLGDSLPDSDRLTEWSRHGPGSNLDTKDGATHLYAKYSEYPYSCTWGAYPEAREAIRNDERWIGAIEDSYRERENIPKHLILDQDAFWNAVITIVPGNRITFVPKNSQTDRSIAIEPSLNLYLQLGVDGFIRRRLKRWGVDLDSQVKNREMARLGSLNWENPENFVTLDLAAASDSISVELCKYMLPRSWFNYLMKLRSPNGLLSESTLVTYEKISSMGNGYTFALESAIFASIIYGAMREFRGSYDANLCAIYGDDLIVPSSLSEPVVAMLNLCGFGINAEKSFVKGPFRESCGADWFGGKAVRPVFLTSLPTTVMGLWTDLNRLRRLLSLRWWIDESSTESLLAKWIPPLYADFTGPVSDEDFDSYRHTHTTTGVYNMCLWKYKRLVVRPVPARGRNLLFRKLMHDLRGQPVRCQNYVDPSLIWRDGHLTASGSRFTLTLKQRVTVSASYSVADIWRTKYTEL